MSHDLLQFVLLSRHLPHPVLHILFNNVEECFTCDFVGSSIGVVISRVNIVHGDCIYWWQW